MSTEADLMQMLVVILPTWCHQVTDFSTVVFSVCFLKKVNIINKLIPCECTLSLCQQGSSNVNSAAQVEDTLVLLLKVMNLSPN